MTEKLVELVQVLELGRYEVNAVQPALLAVLEEELALLLRDEIGALVARRGQYGNEVTHVEGDRATAQMLPVHQIVVEGDKLLEELGMEAEQAHQVVHLALQRVHLRENKRYLVFFLIKISWKIFFKLILGFFQFSEVHISKSKGPIVTFFG